MKTPLLLMLPGALRTAADLVPWSRLWAAEFEVVVVDLPGHGNSPAPTQMSFDALTQSVRTLITGQMGPRQVVVVGESLGGLIALALGNDAPANLVGVVALDPPLSTAKLWTVIDDARQMLTARPQDRFLNTFFDEIFGIRADAVEDRDYSHLLDHPTVPALMLAGEHPLVGPGKSKPSASFLDEADRARLQASPVQFQTVAGAGHALILARPQETYEAARAFILGLPS